MESSTQETCCEKKVLPVDKEVIAGLGASRQNMSYFSLLILTCIVFVVELVEKDA